TREPDTRKFSGQAKLDVLGASVFMDVPITDKTIVTAALRRSFYDAVAAPIERALVPDIGLLVPVYWDYQARLLHKTERMGELSLLAYGSNDHVTRSLPAVAQSNTFNPASLDVSIAFYSLQPKWVLKLSPKVTNTLTAQATYSLSSA